MQNNENHPNRRRIRNFFREKGYYIVLGLCVCAVGVSGWLFVSNAVSEKRSLQSETLSIATSAEDPQAGKSSGGKTAPTTAPAAEETAPAAAMTDDTVREAAASVRVWPVSGEAQAAYSVDALQYNATTQDWRTHSGVHLTDAVGPPVRAAGAPAAPSAFLYFCVFFWGPPAPAPPRRGQDPSLQSNQSRGANGKAEGRTCPAPTKQEKVLRSIAESSTFYFADYFSTAPRFALVTSRA